MAFPHLPSNTRAVSEAGEVKIDQAVIGSCTNGRWEDLVIAAEVMRGKKVHPDVRAIVIPGTQEIYLQAVKEGLVETFIQAGAVVSTPTCAVSYTHLDVYKRQPGILTKRKRHIR